MLHRQTHLRQALLTGLQRVVLQTGSAEAPGIQCRFAPAPAALLQAGGDSGSDAASSGGATSTYVTAPSVLTPVPESPVGTEQNENAAATSTAKSGGRQGVEAGAPANRWRRKNAAERQEGERRQHLAEMRAYFQEASRGQPAGRGPGREQWEGRDRLGKQHTAAAPFHCCGSRAAQS
jgi:hypothetical protein